MKIKANFRDGAPPSDTPAAAPQPTGQSGSPARPTPPCAARNLAIAHHLDRLIERGLVADYSAAARMLGVSQVRMTHLMGLLLLAPEIQAAILLDEMEFGDKELRALARIANWQEQKAKVAARSGRKGSTAARVALHVRAVAAG